jgi:tRNA pseudouridine55 synthase
MIEFNETTDFKEGEILLFNKPAGWTSFDLVKKVKSLIIRRLDYTKIKVGHAGTLDPLAEGLMILCTGKATKEINRYMELDKEYVAILELGKTTPSFDLETPVDRRYDITDINREKVIKSLKKFLGEINQIPPLFSAKNVNGVRAYSFARKGEKIKLKPNKINIRYLELTKYDLPFIEIRILCSKGTYIRALARDLGEILESGAYVTGLKRTKIGHYKLEDAFTIEIFEENLKKLNKIKFITYKSGKK